MRRVRVVPHLPHLDGDEDGDEDDGSGVVELGRAEGGAAGGREQELIRDADLGEPDAELEVAAIHIAPADRGQAIIRMHHML